MSHSIKINKWISRNTLQISRLVMLIHNSKNKILHLIVVDFQIIDVWYLTAKIFNPIEYHTSRKWYSPRECYATLLSQGSVMLLYCPKGVLWFFIVPRDCYASLLSQGSVMLLYCPKGVLCFSIVPRERYATLLSQGSVMLLYCPKGVLCFFIVPRECYAFLLSQRECYAILLSQGSVMLLYCPKEVLCYFIVPRECYATLLSLVEYHFLDLWYSMGLAESSGSHWPWPMLGKYRSCVDEIANFL